MSMCYTNKLKPNITESSFYFFIFLADNINKISSRRNYCMNLFLIFAVTFLIQFLIAFESSFISPIIPYLSGYFNIKESSVIYINIGFSLVGLLSPFFGMLVDKYGKRKAMMVSLMFFVLGTIIGGWAPNPLFFALGRMVIGVGNVTLGATLLSYISDFIPYSKRGRAAGILRIAFALSIMLSPIYSTNMVKYLNLTYLYWSTTIFGIIVLLLSFRLPEDINTDDSTLVTLNLKEVFTIMKNPITIGFLTFQFLIVISPIVVYSFLAIWLKNSFNISQDQIGYVFTLAAIGTVLGVVLSAAFSDRIGKVRFAKISFVLMTLSLAPVPYVKSIYFAVILIILYTIGLDGGWSAFQTISSEVYPKRRTVFMTLLFFMNSICSLLFILIGPTLFDFGGYLLIIWIATITSGLSLVILFRLFSNSDVKKRLEGL